MCESCGCLYIPDLCLRVRLTGDVRQSTLCMGCLRYHHFIVFVNMSCPVLSLSLSLSFFWGGWCELVCVCTRERGGFLFGVGWVF